MKTNEILAHSLAYSRVHYIFCSVPGVPGEAVPISSEEEIFDYIDYPYKTPEERNM